jgi:hypothetical protein
MPRSYLTVSHAAVDVDTVPRAHQVRREVHWNEGYRGEVAAHGGRPRNTRYE